MSLVIVLVLVTLISAFICGDLAKKKQRSMTLWVVLGLLFGPFAIPFIYFAKQE